MDIAKVVQNDEPEPVQPQVHDNEKSSTPPDRDNHQDTTKKVKKEDKVKKDDKSVEQFIKTLKSIPTLEEKFSVVCKKYVQSAEENKKLQFSNKQSDKRYVILLKEKEHLQQEFNKNILLKSKLENLCRELQKQNKAIKEESLARIREEEERHKETQAKLQNSLSEITTLLQQNNERNVKLRDDNIVMTEKFKSVVEQYQFQIDRMAKQMSLESQLYETKFEKAKVEHQARIESLMVEMEQLRVNMAQCKTKILDQQGIETALKAQLAIYTDKYDEFQNAIVKSNQVFGGCKEQMELMSKKIKTLEKQCLSWKKRWEVSQTSLLDMCSERQVNEERAAATIRQLQHMQSLCRTLQAERTVLLNTLKEHNIERPPLPTLSPAPAPAPTPASAPTSASSIATAPAPAPAPASASNNTKMDAMVTNCAQLRQSLAHLQTQLNVLTTNKNGAKEEPNPEPKQKKNKSKKNKQKLDKEEVKPQDTGVGEIVDIPDPVLDTESNKISEVDIPDPVLDTESNKISEVDIPDPVLDTESNKISEVDIPDPVLDSQSNEICEVPSVASNETSVDSSDKSESKNDELSESLMQAINLSNKQYSNDKDVSDKEISKEPAPATAENVILPTNTQEVEVKASIIENQ